MPQLANGFQTDLFSLSPPPATKPHPDHSKLGAMQERILQGKCRGRLKRGKARRKGWCIVGRVRVGSIVEIKFRDLKVDR